MALPRRARRSNFLSGGGLTVTFRSLALIGFAWLGIGTFSWAKNAPLVRDGQSLATILVSQTASEQITQAAKALADHIEQASGARLPVVTDDADFKGLVIVVGKTKLSASDQLPKHLDDDGFVIQVKDDRISIRGPTDWGTEFGVYAFLERYVGVRWLLPGQDGTDVPVAKTIEVPEETVQDSPAFFSRLFSGLSGAPQAQWAQFNRMHGRVKFHHYLKHIFPPETYTRTHPQFFPMKDGKTRFLPADINTHGWQPCFTVQGTVEEAVKNIVRHFNEHPEETSFSLGVNDSSGHCKCSECVAQVGDARNFLGRPDYSDLYYAWCNKVVEGVLKVHPTKWFGCLAYSEVAAPPKKVKLHPRLIPYMTYDRMKWIHPEVAAAGKAATEAWAKATSTLGWYDYIYGTPYCLPRVYFHHLPEYLRYGHQQGVRALYAELYPNWGEGPKPYLFLKLWWNPNQDVDALLREWYERCVGPDAATDLANYYAIWERFWTKDILHSRWFGVGGQYLNFSSPRYLADVREEDIWESRRLLDACLVKCRTEKQRARAKLLEKAFQYYEASALAYLADEKREALTVATESDALTALNHGELGLRMAEKRRHLALQIFPGDPVLLNPLGFDKFPTLAGEQWGGRGLWAVMDWVAKGKNAVRSRVEELTQKSESPAVRAQARKMLRVADGKAKPLSLNPSFEEGIGTTWTYWLNPAPAESVNKSVGRMRRVEDVAHTGKASLLCEGIYRGGPHQSIKFPGPGRYCALAWVYAHQGQDSKGTVELSLTPRGDKGQNLTSFSTKIIPPPGQWTLIVVAADIPAKLGGKDVVSLRLCPIVDSFQTSKIYWDDVALCKE
jgi:hypothetical protein